MNLHKEQRKRESRDRRIRDHDEREHDLDNSQRFLDKKKSVKKAEAYGLSSDYASHDDKHALKSKLWINTMLWINTLLENMIYIYYSLGSYSYNHALYNRIGFLLHFTTEWFSVKEVSYKV